MRIRKTVYRYRVVDVIIFIIIKIPPKIFDLSLVLVFQLCYVKRNGEDVTVIEDDLRICLVRPLNDIDRRYCFEVISPTKSHILQVATAPPPHRYTNYLVTHMVLSG